MFAPAPQLAACLEVLYRASLEARVMGWTGERAGLSSEKSRQLALLMNAVHNIPGLAAEWERCDEQLLRRTLLDYDARYGGHLLKTYDRAVATHSQSGRSIPASPED